VIANLRKGGAHFRIKIHIRGALTRHDALIRVGVQIHPGIGAAASRKPFETQHPAAAGHHRIARGKDPSEHGGWNMKPGGHYPGQRP